MRIAILGSVALPVPPPGQGGTEWIAYQQAIGLSQKGHDILLFAAKGTKENFKDTKVQVIEVGEGDLVSGSAKEAQFDKTRVESSRKLRMEIVYLTQAAGLLIDHKDEYDVILNNMRGEALFLPVAKLLQKPFVNVMHLNLFPALADLFRTYKTHVITISNAQRNDFTDLDYLATVYNGVDIDKYSYNAVPKDYLLMMGSIARHKNQKAAIEVAKKAGMKLVLSGKIGQPDYFAEIKPMIDESGVTYIGEISFAEKLKLYQEAKAFIFPINWDEPFGLVMIEAMSCGTPVVAFNKGAVPEVVVDNSTGFVVEGVDQMIQKLHNIDTISREACRKHVEEKFTIQKMIDDYEKALQKLG